MTPHTGSGGKVGKLSSFRSFPCTPLFLDDREVAALIPGDHVYLGEEGPGRLRVIDVSNTENPVETRVVDTYGTAHDVAVSGSYAYVAAGRRGLWVVDVSTPSRAMRVGNLDIGDIRRVAVSGSNVVVADNSPVLGHLVVVDVGDPRSPTAKGWYTTPRRVEGVAIGRNRVLTAESHAGIGVFDLREDFSAKGGPPPPARWESRKGGKW